MGRSKTGKVAGRVVDAITGKALPGVNIYLEGQSIGTSSDMDGYYAILNIPPGTYTLIASMMGYSQQRVEGLRVSLDVTTEMNFSLDQTTIEGQEVLVIARSPIVQRDLTASKQVLRSDEFNQIPVDDVSDVLALQAGVVRDNDGKIHLRGGRADEVNYLVDGISITDPYAGEMSVEVEISGIEQIQMITGGFNAEYGQALSGVVEIVTKAGGEKYHGKLKTYCGDYFSSNDLFALASNSDLSDVYNLEGNLNGPVPFFNKKLTFNINGKKVYQSS
ncbi:TonB-dependent receptor [bacterium]|nr:TonB-dependent receptor [bacterium]